MTHDEMEAAWNRERDAFYMCETPLGTNVFLEKFMEARQPPYDNQHSELCEKTRDMLANTATSLALLIEVASKNEQLLRSIRWNEDGLGTVSVPVALRRVRRDLDWLDQFFKREPRR